jgi:hypothetical protein
MRIRWGDRVWRGCQQGGRLEFALSGWADDGVRGSPSRGGAGVAPTWLQVVVACGVASPVAGGSTTYKVKGRAEGIRRYFSFL